MSPFQDLGLREVAFRDGFCWYAVGRGPREDGLDPRWASSLLRRCLQDDSFLRERLASWFRSESLTSGTADNRRLLQLLMDEVESGWIRVRELPQPERPVYTHQSSGPARQSRPLTEGKPKDGKSAEPIADEARLLRITACPSVFDPRREPLRISYLLRDLAGRPVELVIRSEAKPEPPLHRRMLTPAQTADGSGKLEWDGLDDNTGEFATRRLAPFLVELVHDASCRDQAQTTPPPTALVHVVEMEDLLFASGRAILMPDGGFDEDAKEEHARATGLHAIAAVLRHAAFHREQKLCVFGHTDTVGNEADNLLLSTDRALNVLHVLTGDAEAWAAHCDRHYQVADFQRVLKWIAKTKGWPTDPGAIDNEFGKASRSARHHFRALMNEQYGTSLQQGVKQNVEDWKAYALLFDEELCRILGASPEELNRIRDQLEFTEPASVGCGEAFPANQPGVNNLPSAFNRRVDVVFFEPHELPQLPGDPPGAPLYASQDYEARYLPIGKGGGKVPVLLRLLDGDEPLAGTAYRIEQGDELLDSGTSQADGTLFAKLPRESIGIVLRLPALGRTYALDIAALPPISQTTGAQGRLCNLGYPCPITGELDEDTQDALLAFQHAHKLPTTGQLDGDTLMTLGEVHDR